MNWGKPLIADGHSPATPLQNVEMSNGHHPEYSASTANPTRATNAQNTSAVRCSITGRPMVLAYVKKPIPSWGAKVPPSDHHSCRHAARTRAQRPRRRRASLGLAGVPLRQPRPRPGRSVRHQLEAQFCRGNGRYYPGT